MSWAWRPAATLVARTPAVGREGQGEGERGTVAHLAFNPDPPPVELHELLGQRQSEPRALLLPRVVPADLTELLEDRRLIFGRDPNARVADGDGDGVLRRGGREADPA